ncbi:MULTISPECIES: hypothetical protein [Shewanella]|uniref:Phage protein n=2 Tax=Shewanella marisflavi TaxID=260364 RepID=A0ABX5WJQ8_9GAMM|nr:MULTISPECIES: hypothetical protein [Shewanella]QDF74757.1 hypothetical protein FGA12_06085 [Shewanella marisflavi]
MSAISQIVEKLQKFPELDYEQSEDFISVNPPNGFNVWLTENENSFTVGFAGWHEDFSEIEDALNCFAFGLSDKCRLKVYKRGSSEYKWIVQALRENEWYDDSETGLLFFPFWRKKQVMILQNTVIGN